ncbi:ecto-ADP-ribosyltransferase 5-like isoform X2 [Aquarana catesbeiana]|uniref:ecto-ADP-ribosyltransferase 5-like isoform X2 n=1 Tax=Aquarana catesbeiana TaxID=8400 RepID=UPI003CC954BD
MHLAQFFSFIFVVYLRYIIVDRFLYVFLFFPSTGGKALQKWTKTNHVVQAWGFTYCRMGSLAGILLSLWLISGIRVGHQAVVFDMMPNTFDDQYIGCEDEMERKVSEILEEELKYNQFAVMWEEASQAWKGKRKSLSLPSNYDDNYGIAVVLYTMETPYPIYRQLNGNVSIMGESRDLYMKNFHFKALHFYLTRALQVLRTGCANKTWVYRGTRIGDVDVAKKMRFGRFTSSSINMSTAELFGENPFFNILTCYSVDIADFSNFEEQEYLISFAETFNMINQIGTKYVLKSTGKLCSYFNCAYLKGEKRSSPVCTSDAAEFPNSWPGTHFIINKLLAILVVIFFF